MVTTRARPDVVRSDVRYHVAAVQSTKFEVSKINRRALEMIRQAADEHGFPVYYASAPIASSLYENEVFRAHFAKLREFLSDWASGSDRVHLLLPEPMTFPAEQMSSADHIVGPAAARYTQRLAEEIQRIESRQGSATQPSGTDG